MYCETAVKFSVQSNGERICNVVFTVAAQ